MSPIREQRGCHSESWHRLRQRPPALHRLHIALVYPVDVSSPVGNPEGLETLRVKLSVELGKVRQTRYHEPGLSSSVDGLVDPAEAVVPGSLLSLVLGAVRI